MVAVVVVEWQMWWLWLLLSGRVASKKYLFIVFIRSSPDRRWKWYRKSRTVELKKEKVKVNKK